MQSRLFCSPWLPFSLLIAGVLIGCGYPGPKFGIHHGGYVPAPPNVHGVWVGILPDGRLLALNLLPNGRGEAVIEHQRVFFDAWSIRRNDLTVRFRETDWFGDDVVHRLEGDVNSHPPALSMRYERNGWNKGTIALRNDLQIQRDCSHVFDLFHEPPAGPIYHTVPGRYR